MSTVLTEDGNPLTIELRGDATARLFGAPFLLIGGYLAYINWPEACSIC
jgi:hypothetical protein